MVCDHTRKGNTLGQIWAGDAQSSPWAQLQPVGGLVEGPFCNCLFITNLTGLGTQRFYNALHDWISDVEGAMHAAIAIPQLHGSDNIHVHFESHGATRDCKWWVDHFHSLTKHLRPAPGFRFACKSSNYATQSCPQELSIPSGSPWSDPLVLASWDPNIIHPHPCPPPPCPHEHKATG